MVTELGGLLSHGAVVAREFGLPCLVSAQGATKAIASGSPSPFIAAQDRTTSLQATCASWMPARARLPNWWSDTGHVWRRKRRKKTTAAHVI